mmetsp:Transcript_1588/g.3493  ORF Transcript_1588/g.3493 Transcript_1588/m.3493 type:complete len:229 (+) Transcript_1588:99-785(+)
MPDGVTVQHPPERGEIKALNEETRQERQIEERHSPGMWAPSSVPPSPRDPQASAQYHRQGGHQHVIGVVKLDPKHAVGVERHKKPGEGMGPNQGDPPRPGHKTIDDAGDHRAHRAGHSHDIVHCLGGLSLPGVESHTSEPSDNPLASAQTPHQPVPPTPASSRPPQVGQSRDSVEQGGDQGGELRATGHPYKSPLAEVLDGAQAFLPARRCIGLDALVSALGHTAPPK